jgi:hypothetical protein
LLLCSPYWLNHLWPGIRDNSPVVLAAVHGDGSVALQYRATPGHDIAEKVLPVRVTPNGPSYFHGGSPDGKQIVFVSNSGFLNY